MEVIHVWKNFLLDEFIVVLGDCLAFWCDDVDNALLPPTRAKIVDRVRMRVEIGFFISFSIEAKM